MAEREGARAAVLVAGHGSLEAGEAALHTLGQIGEALLATSSLWRAHRLSTLDGERNAPDRAGLKHHIAELTDCDTEVILLVIVGYVIDHDGEPSLVTGAGYRDNPSDATLPLRWLLEQGGAAQVERAGSVDPPRIGRSRVVLPPDRLRHVPREKPLARSKEILGNIDLERVRKLPTLKYYFENRGRMYEKPKATEAIIGNVAVDPDRSGKTETILPAGDLARDARVERGTDVQLFDRFNPFYKETRSPGLPLAAGISGSTADYIEMAKLAGLSKADLQRFAMAIIYYLTLPGHHSFHEVATVLAADGIISYRPDPGVGDYASPLTETIRRSDGYKALARKYPGLLQSR